MPVALFQSHSGLCWIRGRSQRCCGNAIFGFTGEAAPERYGDNLLFEAREKTYMFCEGVSFSKDEECLFPAVENVDMSFKEKC